MVCCEYVGIADYQTQDSSVAVLLRNDKGELPGFECLTTPYLITPVSHLLASQSH